MEEKIFITSRPVPFRKPLVICIAILLLVIFVIPYVYYILDYNTCDEYQIVTIEEENGDTLTIEGECGEDAPDSLWNGRYFYGKCREHRQFKDSEDYAENRFEKILPTIGGISCGLVSLTILLLIWWRSGMMTVTDKRVYGRAAFGERVDLPMDSIAAFGTRWPKGLFVASASGKISFLMLQNRDDIYRCISDLLIARQSSVKTTASGADELKKYKELLDEGGITQAEYVAKKRELLGF